MKKFISVLLAASMVLAFAACTEKDNDDNDSGRGSGESTEWNKHEYAIVSGTGEPWTEPSEEPTVTETETAAPTVSPTPAPTENPTESGTETVSTGTSTGAVTDYVIDIRDDYKYLEGSGEYHVPLVLLDSDYADEMREEISARFEYYAELVEEDGWCHYWATKYIAFLNTDFGVLSVVFVEEGDWDDDIFHVWNFDITTGDKVDNSDIADMAGIYDIRTAAMDGAQAYYNRYDTIVEDYTYIGDDVYMEDYVNASFSEEYMNDDMMMGITDDGRVFFISELASFGGAPTYYEMYDQYGLNMYYEDGWVQLSW